MKQQFPKILLLVFITGYFFSCNTVKRVADDEHLLLENTVIVNDKKNNTEIINDLLHQKPNSKLPLIGNLRLNIYNLARPNRDSIFEAWLDKKPKRRERLKKTYSQKQVNRLKEAAIGFNNWLKKTGEPPVIVNPNKTKKSAERLEAYYKAYGWFDHEVSYNIIKNKNKRASVEYKINTGKPYLIDSIYTSISSPLLDSLYRASKKESFVVKQNQYKDIDLINERKRLEQNFRNSGLYHFSQDNIEFDVIYDNQSKLVDVDVIIKNRAIRTQDTTIRKPFKIYTIRDVNITTDYTFENRGKPFQESISYSGFKLNSYNTIKYRPKALTDAIFINPGTVFKDLDRTRTFRHLNELRTFKYPDINYVENPDSTLTANIHLTPLKKFGLGFSAEASQSNIQSFGFSLNPSLLIRNIFRGAETFEVSAFGSIGASKDAANKRDQFFDINELGVDLKLTIPRLFSPFYTENIVPKYMLPSTRISLSATSQTNVGLDKQTFTGTFNYKWNPNSIATNRLDLFNVQYVRNLNIGNYFGIYQNAFSTLENIALKRYTNTPSEFISLDENGNQTLIKESADPFINLVLNDNSFEISNPTEYKTVNSIDERKKRLTENNLIFSSSYSFTQDKRQNLFDEDFSIFRFKIEAAGNLFANTSKLLGFNKNENNRYELFNVAYSQYIKTEFDYIKHWDLGRKNVLSLRGFFGIAIPYGNSSSIPFSKSFFAGGANDNRAWTAYGLGPGSSETTDEFNEANLKLAFSLEQRFNIFENLNGAVFIDLGNIWNVLDDVEDDSATFTKFSSLKDIAIGSGFGFRYDFSFFVFRFDIGFKTHDPSYRNQNRWFNDYNFANAVYNIGINYPF
ncbi:translocation and assembly module lipoprotein TamL [Gelatiniphilus marinus]|uniref:BamA/TamA family outer membrane protein n=1 Tax=Gelatiniphilus marinus TaxID=1759464 RepID=A0ABW5JRI8_9FLAO